MNGTQLKIIAIVTMILDHITKIILYRHNYISIEVAYILTGIGRISFPIYCFLLTEGIKKTSNINKYLLRLGLFAIFSEIPFNLAISNQVMYLYYQNVFFSLFLGACTVVLLNRIISIRKSKINTLTIFTSILFASLAEILHFDYGYFGIVIIIVFYYFDTKKDSTNIILFLVILISLTNTTDVSYKIIKIVFYTYSIFLIKSYDGSLGKGIPQKISYSIYPAHLTFLAYISSNFSA